MPVLIFWDTPISASQEDETYAELLNLVQSSKEEGELQVHLDITKGSKLVQEAKTVRKGVYLVGREFCRGIDIRFENSESLVLIVSHKAPEQSLQ